MNSPIMLYKIGGDHLIEGVKVDYKIFDAEDDMSMEEAATLGYKTHAETFSGNDDSQPSRSEMELKAKELGIKFDGRTGDARLLKLIEDAIKG